MRQITLNNKLYIVNAIHILGTREVVITAWEHDQPTKENNFHNHSTITHFEVDGKVQRFGKVATRELPDDLNALPAGSDERIRAVQHYHSELGREAEIAIHAALPETRLLSINSYGEIEVILGSIEAAKEYVQLVS